ncbi:MAG TPA: DegV family protein, partial [Lachnospiraceae bacterium]|nr:DegV family protein [Lachnospiraceae bacterium]
RLYVIEAARMQKHGYSYEQTVNKLMGQMRDTARIIFTVGNLDYLQHGGRIGKVAGIAGSILNLKPLITLADGSIDSSGIARSRKKSMLKTIELIKSYFKENGENPKNYAFAVGFGYDRQEGVFYREMINTVLKGLGAEDGADLVQIGATICVHTGPFALGAGFVKRFEFC